MNHYIIIVAGGKGLRMESNVPKQFLHIAGKPVLMRTIERFWQYSNKLGIIVVLPHEQQQYWKQLCQQHHFTITHTMIDGGKTRFESSRNGINAIPHNANGVVGIHDGVRPFVSVEVIKRCYDTAMQCGAAIPVLPVTDTLRFVDEEGNAKNVLRSNYRIVQTPQVFDIQLAKKAFQQQEKACFTDDASVIETLGKKVEIVDGNRENIKITTPFDLSIAEFLIQ